MSLKLPSWLANLLLTVLSLLLVLAGGELLFGYLERQGKAWPEYEEAFGDGLSPGGRLKPGYSAMMRGGYGEPVRWQNNAQGFRNDYDVEPGPAPRILRIISMGDSFAAGYRLAQEQTYSYLLEQALAQDCEAVQVLVSHAGGPARGLYYLEKFGMQFDPQLVLFGLTLGNDLAEVYASFDKDGGYSFVERGGLVGISKQKSSISFPTSFEHMMLPPESLGAPSWSAQILGVMDDFSLWRRISALVAQPQAIKSFYKDGGLRLFDPTNGLGMYLCNPPEPIDQAYSRLFKLLKAYDAFCKSRGVEFVLALWPQRFQVQPEDWEQTVAVYGLRPEAFDLDAPNNRIAEFCRQQGITCIDPTRELRKLHLEGGEELYLAMGDMHWNAAGNSAVAGILYRELLKQVKETRRCTGR